MSDFHRRSIGRRSLAHSGCDISVVAGRKRGSGAWSIAAPGCAIRQRRIDAAHGFDQEKFGACENELEGAGQGITQMAAFPPNTTSPTVATPLPSSMISYRSRMSTFGYSIPNTGQYFVMPELHGCESGSTLN